MDQIPCPDGFLLHASSPLADAHHALNQYLVRHEEAGWKTATKELNALRGKRLKLRIWKAFFQRLEWLREHNPESPCFGPLRDIAYAIEKWKLELTEADLLEILTGTARLAGQANSYAPMPHLMAYVAERGLTQELSAAIRAYRARVEEEKVYVNQPSLQLFNSRMDMLAWRDEWDAIDLKKCWSQQIRADFRALSGAEREHWRLLLYSIEGDEATRPAPKWLQFAQAQIQTIGPAAFRTRLLGWFDPLRRGSTQPLSRPGSFILRSFIWLAQSLNEPELMGRVGEIPEVKFKPKKNADKVVRAAAEAVGREVPACRPTHPAPSFDAITARALAAVLSPASWGWAPPQIVERLRVDGEVVHVRGDLDTYRVHLSTGAIFRESDGKRVHVALERVQIAQPPELSSSGIVELLRQILVLAEDAKHPQAFTFSRE